jgi:hypothetical protein
MSASASPRGLIQVVIFLVGSFLSLWVLVLLFGSLLEPIADVARNIPAVQNTGRASMIDRVMSIVPMAGLVLGVGAILLTIIYAVFREQFIGRTGRVRRP